MMSPWSVSDEYTRVEVACSCISRPCMDAYVVIFLGALETLVLLGNILHDGHMEASCLLERTPCL